MLYIVILEVLVVAGMAIAVLKDEKNMNSAFNSWLGVKQVYRIPLRIIMREEVKKVARHRYVHN
jgi:hypothetical protein